VPATAPHFPCEEALRELADGRGDVRRCVQTLTPLLFALADHLKLPEHAREQAVGDALKDICEHCAQWPRTRLPAQVWVLAMARRRFRHGHAA